MNIIRLGFPINLILRKKFLNAISFVKNEDEFYEKKKELKAQIKEGFCKYKKSNTKLIHNFFETFICSIHPKSSDYLRKYHYFYFFIFSKISFLLSHLYLLRVFIILQLSSIHQPTWTTNLKLLMHLKIDFDSFYLISYDLKTTSISLSLCIHGKNPRFWF